MTRIEAALDPISTAVALLETVSAAMEHIEGMNRDGDLTSLIASVRQTLDLAPPMINDALIATERLIRGN